MDELQVLFLLQYAYPSRKKSWTSSNPISFRQFVLKCVLKGRALFIKSIHYNFLPACISATKPFYLKLATNTFHIPCFLPFASAKCQISVLISQINRYKI